MTYNKKPISPPTPKPLQSEGVMDYESLMTTLKYLFDAAFGSDEILFTANGPNVNDPRDVKFPCITHKLSRLGPAVLKNGVVELKPRIRMLETRHTNEELKDSFEEQAIKVYGHMLDAEVVFTVWDETNEKVEGTSKLFRQTMQSFIPFVKSKGIKEMYMMGMSDDSSGSEMRDNYKTRTLKYFVRFEEITIQKSEILRAIEVVDEKLSQELRR